MTDQRIMLTVVAGLLAVSGSANADHNSKNGEGWANMPNDIHNTRVETLGNDDADAFRDFVRYGEGADSVNRFGTDDTKDARASGRQANARAAGQRAKSGTTGQGATGAKADSGNRSRVSTRSRFEIENQGGSRMNRAATRTGASGSRRGRGPR